MGSGESAFWVIDTAGVLMYVAAVIWFMSSKRLFRAPSDRTDWYVHQRS
jgi:hypothetical protein